MPNEDRDDENNPESERGVSQRLSHACSVSAHPADKREYGHLQSPIAGKKGTREVVTNRGAHLVLTESRRGFPKSGFVLCSMETAQTLPRRSEFPQMLCH